MMESNVKHKRTLQGWGIGAGPRKDDPLRPRQEPGRTTPAGQTARAKAIEMDMMLVVQGEARHPGWEMERRKT